MFLKLHLAFSGELLRSQVDDLHWLTVSSNWLCYALVMWLLPGKRAAHKTRNVVIVGIIAHLDWRARKLKCWQLLWHELGWVYLLSIFTSAALYRYFLWAICVFKVCCILGFDHHASFLESCTLMYFCSRSGLLTGADWIDELLNLSWLNIQSGRILSDKLTQCLKLLHLRLLESLLLCFFVQIWFFAGFLLWAFVSFLIRSRFAVIIFAILSIEIRFAVKGKLLPWYKTSFASFLWWAHFSNSHLVLNALLIDYFVMKLNVGLNLFISEHSFVPQLFFSFVFLISKSYLFHLTLMFDLLIFSYFHFLLDVVFLHFEILHYLVLLLLLFLSKLVFQFQEFSSYFIFTVFWNFFNDSQSIFSFVNFLIFPVTRSFALIGWVAASSGWWIVVSIWHIGIQSLVFTSGVPHSDALWHLCWSLVEAVLLKCHTLVLKSRIKSVKLHRWIRLTLIALTNSMVSSWTPLVVLF